MPNISHHPEYDLLKALPTKALSVDNTVKHWIKDQVDACLEHLSSNVLLVPSHTLLRKKCQREDVHQSCHDGVLPTGVGISTESFILERDMFDEMERYMSFLHKNWPTDAPVSSSKLAKEGFFYIGVNAKCKFATGKDNEVKYFHFVGGLKKWEVGDDLREEHTRLSTCCEWLLKQRDIGFVDNVRRKFNQSYSEPALGILANPNSGQPAPPHENVAYSKDGAHNLLPRKKGTKRLPEDKQTNQVKSSEENVHFQAHTTPPQPLAVKQSVQGSGHVLVRHDQLNGVKSEDGSYREREPKKGKPLRQTGYSWIKHCHRALSLLLLLLLPLSVFSFPATEVCHGNQTAELGRQGSIICHFPDGLNEVHWIDSSETSYPVITYKPNTGEKSGPGLESGAYDIHEDGSLSITNVSIWNEGRYEAIIFLASSLTPVTYPISLEVIASPVDDLPMIPCRKCPQEYYHSAEQGEIPLCSFNATRPPMQLEWFKKFVDGYEYLEMQQFNTTENSNGTFNSLAAVHLLKGSSNFIHLLVCRATWPLSDWRRERNILVDFSSNITFSDVTPKIQHMEIHRYAQLHCGQPGSIYVVWKRILPNSEPEIIGFLLHGMTETTSDIPDVEVSSEGSLIFASPRVQHEGMYICISGDGQKEEIQMTSLEILIPPSPPYIQITECNPVSHGCVIREDSTMELTCTVYGARPVVTLEWSAENGDVFFANYKVDFNERGETFDTILSVEYKVSPDVLCGEELLIKCHLNGPLSNIMKEYSAALVIPASCRENEVKGEQGVDGTVIAVMVFFGIFIVIVITVRGIRSFRLCNWTKSTTSAAYNDVPVRDSQEASLDNETREPVGEVPDGIPLRNVNAASLDNETREPAGQVPHGIAGHNVNDTNEDVV